MPESSYPSKPIYLYHTVIYWICTTDSRKNHGRCITDAHLGCVQLYLTWVAVEIEHKTSPAIIRTIFEEAISKYGKVNLRKYIVKHYEAAVTIVLANYFQWSHQKLLILFNHQISPRLWARFIEFEQQEGRHKESRLSMGSNVSVFLTRITSNGIRPWSDTSMKTYSFISNIISNPLIFLKISFTVNFAGALTKH